MRGGLAKLKAVPDVAALHPGYMVHCENTNNTNEETPCASQLPLE
jgi:hypothetical protein